MSNNNVTYFLGAGASAGKLDREDYNPAIPILSDFNEALQSFFKKIIIEYFNKKDPSRSYVSFSDEEFFSDTINNASSLRSLIYTNQVRLYEDSFIFFIIESHKVLLELNGHTTVDTLARKYFLLGSEGEYSLIILKALLSVYFLHLQQNKNRFDMRYDSFVSTLLSRVNVSNLALPNNIKIVSWNYDLQFEIALKKYHKASLKQIQKDFGIHPSIEYSGSSRTMDSFGMVKLNGSAGLFLDASTKTLKDIDEVYPGEILPLELFELFDDITRKRRFIVEPFYRYSWEDDNKRYDLIPNMNAQLHGYAHDIMCQTNHLVVIGYSFPPFNRRLDIALFNSLPNDSVVYIQDKNPLVKQNVEDIFSDFIQRNITIKFIEDVSQFHIPPVYFEDN